MNQEQFLEKIGNIEENFPVNNYTYKSIHVWPVVRMLLLFTFKSAFTQSSPYEIPEVQDLSLKARLIQAYIAFRHYLKSRTAVKKIRSEVLDADIILYSRASEYGDNVNGKKYNKLTDPFLEYFNSQKINAVKIELKGAQHPPRLFETQFFSAEDYLIFKRGKAMALNSNSYENLDFRVLLDETEKQTGVKLPSSAVAKAIVNICMYKDMFIEILKKNKPKAVFLTVYYAQDSFGLVMACRALNIPVVDIQHGKQGRFHFMYSHWTKIPKEGYAILPDYFWNWGKESETNISSWMPSWTKHKAITGGNLWMLRWKENKNPDTEETMAFFTNIKRYKRIVLFSLQPLGDVNFPDFVIQTIRETADDCFWLLRLHPKMKAEDVPLLKKILAENPNTEMHLSSSLPLFRLLEESSWHVTCWSSVAFEALAFNVPTILIHPEALSLYKENVSKGIFLYASDKETFMDFLFSDNSGQSSDYIVYDKQTADRAMDRVLGS